MSKCPKMSSSYYNNPLQHVTSKFQIFIGLIDHKKFNVGFEITLE